MSAATPIDNDDLFAAEYALGLLDTPERRLAERRLRHDEPFRREVGAWEERLAPLLMAAPPVAPSPELWAEVEAALPTSARRAPPASASRIAGLVPAFWRSLALGSGALAAASLAGLLALALVPAALPPAGGPMLVASIGAEGGDLPLFTAVVDPRSGEATLVPVRIDPGAGRVPELWLIAAEGAAPVSLGVVDPSAPIRVDLAVPREGTGAAPVLAISLEPPGGSPTGSPTGPVVGTGALRTI